MNSQKYTKELYPEDFTEEDKLKSGGAWAQ